MGNEFSTDDVREDPSRSVPLLERFPTKDELAKLLPPGRTGQMAKHFLLNWDNQRQLDLRWALLAANHRKGESLSFNEWQDLYKRSGLDLVANSTRLNKNVKLSIAELNESGSYSYTLTKNFPMPEKIPRKCDHCDTVLDAPKYCICGEVYCNESCRGLEKTNHKKLCDIVQENNEIATSLIVQWQRQQKGSSTCTASREEVLVSRTTFRDNVLSFGGLKVVYEVFNVYSNILDRSRVQDVRILADGSGPSAVHASYLYGKLCDDPEIRGAPEKLANKYLQFAADQGLGPAWVVLGNRARDKGDFKLAKQCWTRALGICRVPEAAYNIGVIYGLGYDGPKDYPLALDFYQEAVDSPLPHCGNREIPDAIADNIIYGIYTGNNENQETFVTQARRNLGVVRRYGQPPAKTIRLIGPSKSVCTSNNNSQNSSSNNNTSNNRSSSSSSNNGKDSSNSNNSSINVPFESVSTKLKDTQEQNDDDGSDDEGPPPLEDLRNEFQLLGVLMGDSNSIQNDKDKSNSSAAPSSSSSAAASGNGQKNKRGGKKKNRKNKNKW